MLLQVCPSGLPTHRLLMQLQLVTPHSSAQLLVDTRVQVGGGIEVGATQVMTWYCEVAICRLQLAPTVAQGCPTETSHKVMQLQFGTPHSSAQLNE